MSLELAVLLAGLGFLAAFLSGLLGIGGGLAIIPLLLYLPEWLGLASFDLKAAAAIGVAQITTATGAGTFANFRRGLIYKRLAAVVIGAMAVGALGGGWVSQFLPIWVLKAVFASFASLAAAVMLLPVSKQELGPAQPRFNWPLALLCGLGVGIGIGLVGGGAFMLVPLQVYLLRVPTRTAIATGLAAGFPGAASALVGKTLGHQVPFLPALTVCILAIPGAQLGAAVGARLSARVLRRAYAMVVMTVAGGLWYDVLHLV